MSREGGEGGTSQTASQLTGVWLVTCNRSCPIPNHTWCHVMSHHILYVMVCATGLASLAAVPVNHCHDAFGLVMLHTDGWKLVYSGDTRPCRALQAAGKACTLLIHEATFEAELIEHAKTKKHSTTEEAVQVAAAMRAYRVILTHFSQRYSKVPVGLKSVGTAANTAMIAFDGMSVPLTLLPYLPKLAEGIELAFAVEKSEKDVDALVADC